MAQLLHRMELSVTEFNAELETMVSRLAENAATQEELIDRIRNRYPAQPDTEATVADDDEEGITEWEKRLAEIEEPSD